MNITFVKHKYVSNDFIKSKLHLKPILLYFIMTRLDNLYYNLGTT